MYMKKNKRVALVRVPFYFKFFFTAGTFLLQGSPRYPSSSSSSFSLFVNSLVSTIPPAPVHYSSRLQRRGGSCPSGEHQRPCSFDPPP
jgi:hypothetical protein